MSTGTIVCGAYKCDTYKKMSEKEKWVDLGTGA